MKFRGSSRRGRIAFGRWPNAMRLQFVTASGGQSANWSQFATLTEPLLAAPALANPFEAAHGTAVRATYSFSCGCIDYQSPAMLLINFPKANDCFC